MLKFIRAAAAVLAVAAVTGCAGMITGGPLIRPGEPTAPSASQTVAATWSMSF